MPCSMLYGMGDPPTSVTPAGRLAASRFRPSSCASQTTISEALAARQPSTTASRSARIWTLAAAAAEPSRAVSRSATTPEIPSRSMAMNNFMGTSLAALSGGASDARHERLCRPGSAHAPRQGGDEPGCRLEIVAVGDFERRVHVAHRQAERQGGAGAGGHEFVGVRGALPGVSLDLHRDALGGGHLARQGE